MRYFFLSFILLIVTVIAFAGFRGSKFSQSPIELFNDMDHQNKSKAQSGSNFFADGRSARPPIPGTVPMGFEVPAKAASAGGAQSVHGFALADDYLNTGKMGEFYGHGMPDEITLDEALLARGQERYGIYCGVCHGASGNGGGVISKYGLAVANLVIPPVSDPALKPDGRLYDVIVNGNGGLMGGYGASLTIHDRWAIVAYVRTLQQRMKMPAADVKEAFDAWEATQKKTEEPAPENAS